MDLKRRFSTGDIDPKVSRSAIGRSEFSPKLTRFENSLFTTTKSESNRGRTMSSTDKVVNNVSPLKRKSSTSQIEMTSLHHCDAKRRRHHRRKPNKKWRHKSVTAEKSKSVCQNTASSTTSTTATAKCQKDKKLNGSANSNNCSSASHLLWKKKRKQQFFHQNSGATVTGTTSGSGQHNNTLQSQRLAGHGGACRKRANDVVLRPTKVPLLNAPRNSTQFIIDDHESSDLVWNFETRTTVPRHQQQPKEVSAPVER